MVHTLNKIIIFAILLIAGCSFSAYSRPTEAPKTFVKKGMYTVVVRLFPSKETCIIEQYNNVGTNLVIEYHKDKYSYVRQGDCLILRSCSKHAPSSVRKIYTSAYYSLCFYPQTRLTNELSAEKIFPSLLPMNGVLADRDGYYYALPSEIRADVLFSDSCLFMHFGEEESVLLLNSSIADGIPSITTRVKEAMANVSGWGYFWNNRPRLSTPIDKHSIVNHIFVHHGDSISFEKGRVGSRYDSLTQERTRFKYRMHDSYVVMKTGLSTDTLLYHDGALYEARVLQEKSSAPRTILGTAGIRQQPTGEMRISVYVESSNRYYDEATAIMNIRRYFFPINFRYVDAEELTEHSPTITK